MLNKFRSDRVVISVVLIYFYPRDACDYGKIMIFRDYELAYSERLNCYY